MATTHSDEGISEKLEEQKNYGDSAYDPGPRALEIESAYFYYILPGAAGDLSDATVAAYFYDHKKKIENINSVVDFLGYNAVMDADWPPQLGASVDVVKWRRKSSLIFLIDSEIIKFSNGGAIEFKSGASCQANHSFYDGHDGDVVVTVSPGGDTRPMNMFYCTNYICDARKENLGERVQEHFCFRLVVEGAGAGGSREMRFFPDSGGTNMGPPPPPPFTPY
jgi:hypothetical protein